MQVQRTRHTRAYVQIPNEIARHSSLSLEAVGLLTRLLSLPDANGATVERVTAAVPNGRRTVSNAMNELITAGYVKRARVQDPESGRWVTITSVTDAPADHMPTVGLPSGQAVGGYPKGVIQEGNDLLPEVGPEADECLGESQQQEGEESPSPSNGNSTSGTADAVTGRAAACLNRLRDFEPRLRLTTKEALRLAPLAARWLADDLHEMEVITALTRALPASIESAAALVSFRLKHHQPEKSELRQSPAPAPTREQRTQCRECRAPFRLGVTADLCRDCRTNA
ncbi:hypothetical protein [Streptomyces antarcticus]|uniref:hypothetical protein n=1 Tax=Streptomyces antarcticus TaxID=2996458 RepID=UPI00226F80A0|nr:MULTISPECIES: hypothetical protein [unclassified Streptomyces]MCY0941941.1 hypothetical protein [Streptomyces sp. H34-AA3]MCZ4082787.1 hypothetical protein [Streptomyces sp. H34-S5]